MTLRVELDSGYHDKDWNWHKEPCLTLYLPALEESEHKIPLKELAEALKPFLKDEAEELETIEWMDRTYEDRLQGATYREAAKAIMEHFPPSRWGEVFARLIARWG